MLRCPPATKLSLKKVFSPYKKKTKMFNYHHSSHFRFTFLPTWCQNIHTKSQIIFMAVCHFEPIDGREVLTGLPNFPFVSWLLTKPKWATSCRCSTFFAHSYCALLDVLLFLSAMQMLCTLHDGTVCIQT